MYYKVKQNNMIIDALENLQCVRFFEDIGRVLRCGADDNPQGIISRDSSTIWHVDGWDEFPVGNYETVTIEGLYDEELYKDILEKVSAGEDYSDFVQPEEDRTEEEIRADPTPMERLEALEAAKASEKIKHISEEDYALLDVTDSETIYYIYGNDGTVIIRRGED